MDGKRKADQMAVALQPKKPRTELVSRDSSKGSSVVATVSFIY